MVRTPRGVASLALALFLCAAGTIDGRKLVGITNEYIGCNGGSCSHIYTQTSDQGTGVSSATPLSTAGIVTTGSYNGTFACFTQSIPVNLRIEIVGSAVTPSIVTTVDESMTCVSSAPLFCDLSCCWVDGVAGVQAKACNAAAPALAPAALVPAAPAAAPPPGSVVCTPAGRCAIDGKALSSAGITTNGTYSGLWACWSPPTKAPIAPVPMGALDVQPGSVVTPSGAMQCVSDASISCDFSCCSPAGSTKTSCKKA